MFRPTVILSRRVPHHGLYHYYVLPLGYTAGPRYMTTTTYCVTLLRDSCPHVLFLHFLLSCLRNAFVLLFRRRYTIFLCSTNLLDHCVHCVATGSDRVIVTCLYGGNALQYTGYVY